MKNVLIIVGVLVVFVVVLFVTGIMKPDMQKGVPPAGERTEVPQAPMPKEAKGNLITIRDCAADPQILEMDAGDSVTFKNVDAVDHTLFSPEIGGEVKLAANQLLTITPKFPFKNFTTNYMCDQQSLPKGGAIYAKP